MLVALAVFAILVLLVAGILGQVNQMWALSESQAQRQENSRALLNYLARDISKAMAPLNPTSQSSLDFVIDPPSLPTSYAYHDNIFFQAPVATDASAGELAEVGYFVQWRPDNTAQLCRFFVNPSDTSNYQVYNTSGVGSPPLWLINGSMNYIANVASGAAPNYPGLLAENVIGLWITPYSASGSFLQTDVGTYGAGTYDSRSPIASANRKLPAVIDLSILVLDPPAAKRVSMGVVPASAVQALVQSSAYANAAQCMTNLPVILRPGATCYSTRVNILTSQ